MKQLMRLKNTLDQFRATEESCDNLGQEINLLNLQIQEKKEKLVQFEEKDIQEKRIIWSTFRSLKSQLDRETRYLSEEQNSERWAMEKCLRLALECAASGNLEEGSLQTDQSQIHLKRMNTIGSLILEVKKRIQEAEIDAQEKISALDYTSYEKIEDSLESSQLRLKELTFKFGQLKQECDRLKIELDTLKIDLQFL